MAKGKTTGKKRLDRFYHLAKEQGYRSRAAFKLLQLDAKYGFLSGSRALLDLCAAPGGWMQVASKNMPVGSLIVGVDLVPIRPIRGAFSLQEDITTPKCRATIRKLLKEKGSSVFDVVLHDGSPNVGGAWAKESASQASLVVDSLKLATEFLTPKGTFVTKVFRSQDYTSLLYAFKQLFEKVEVTKPVASRATSAEIYVICLKYRAPAKIDPRLLDGKYLFQEIVEPPKVVDVLRGTKQKRNREGYEEGNTTLQKKCLASDFIWTDKPLEMLGSITSISFEDPNCYTITSHPETTDEVKILCEDLRVLGKQEFKLLLKWRLKIRKELSPVKDSSAINKTEAIAESDDEDEKILNEMEELKEIMEAKKKKEKKLLSKRRAKTKARTGTGMQIDVMEDGYGESNLFSLSSIRGKKDLEAVEIAETSDEDSDDHGDTDGARLSMDSDHDIDDREKYDAELEEYLDHAYNLYRKATDGSSKRRKRAKLADKDNKAELWQETKTSEYVGDVQADNAGHAGIDRGEENPLMVPLIEDRQPSKEQLMQQWFSQDVFAEINEASDDDTHQLKTNGIKKFTEMGVENPSFASPLKAANVPVTKDSDGNFEIVPAELSSSEDTSDDEDYDSDAKAEILAYAKKMLHKKDREDIIESSYNRYTFNDENLPEWFVDDEKRHCQPIKPVTAAEIEAMKAQFQSVNARPVKKIAEAKARKKRRALKKLEGVKQKANAIADQADVSAHSKSKMMERLYKKALTPNKPKKEVVVAKKGMGGRARKGKIMVDRRMKKDKRIHGMSRCGKGKMVTKGNKWKSGKKSGPQSKKSKSRTTK